MPTKRPAPAKKPPVKKAVEKPSPLEAVIARFALDDVEAAILRALGDAELSLDAWRAHHTDGGPSARTVGLDVATVLERLRPDSRLRRHALVHVDALDRLASASDVLRLEVGLVPRQQQLPSTITRYAPSVRVPSELAKRLDGNGPQVVLLDATPTQMSAQSIADGLQRPVLAGSVRGLSRDTLARLRRDADLEDAILWLVADDAALASLLVEPVGQALVVLAEMAHVDAKAPWRVRREKMVSEPGVAPAAPRNELDYVRMLAQRDADAALGIVRAAPTPPRPTVPGKIVDATVRVAETKPEPPKVEAKVEAPKVEAPKIEAKVEAPKIETPPEPPKVEEKIEAPAAEPEVAAAPTEPQPDAAPEPPDGPRMDVAADASTEVRARAAITSQSAKQRIELMEGLATYKGATVVAALRHNAKSEHAGVRAVAERIMGQMFGSNWNRTRAVAPPVQPPRSPDDKP